MGALYSAFAGVLTNEITQFVLEEPLISFESVVMADVPAYSHEVILPGILEKFDMDQVYQSLCQRPVSVINPLSGDKAYAGDSERDRMDKMVTNTYGGQNSQGSWSIQKTSAQERKKAILDGLEYKGWK